MEYVKLFEEIDKNSLLIAGGKGANLGEMVKLNLPVPPGFVITVNAFEEFLDKNLIRETIKRWLKECDVENTEQLLETSGKIKELIINQEIPEKIRNEILEAYEKFKEDFVAVRSSATAEDLPTASFAGQQATFLNVKGEKELFKAIKKCWASLYEPRAIFYREKQGISEASIAVIVQKMVNSEKSGVIFTIHPATSEEKILIEAVFGLGEAIVSGEVSPDEYVVDKESMKIVEKKIGRKEIMRIRENCKTVTKKVEENKVNAQVLNDKEILELANYSIILEKHYKAPQDIEFAIEKGKIYILQTRNVTTRKRIEKVKVEKEAILEGLPASPGIAVGKVKIVHSVQDIAKVEKGNILVTEMTSPDLVPTMSKSAAIITDKGGYTCHAAIVSRELGIPCVVGTKNATKILKDDMLITVDAYSGKIYEGEVKISKIEEKEEFVGKTKTKIKVNLILPEKAEEVAKICDGVGLLRIEHAILKFGKHPAYLIKSGKSEEYEKILIELIKPIAKAFYPKPVWVRSLDARSDELRNLEGGENEEKEPNPMLGWHGIRRSLDEPELLKAEIRAIKKLFEEGLDNISLMLPFVVDVNEFRKAKEIANKILPELKIGIMVETPACSLTIEEFCKAGIAFASIGSNDLAMLTLGADRNNEKVAKIYSEFHPSIIKQIEHVIKTCKKYKVESSICGEAGSDPEFAKILVRFGIDSISVNFDAISKIRKAVFEVEEKER